MESIQKLLDIMRKLRDPEDGCPWDVQQSFATIAPYTIEEAYEVADAIAREDIPGLGGELGDLLLQVVFHAQMADEAGHFNFDDIANGIAEKMIRRHPHVFGSKEERETGKVDGSWEEIKEQERVAAGDGSALAGVTRALPALKRAEKLGKRAARVGFDWPDRKGVRAKIHEELDELDAAVVDGDRAGIEDELGDLLFAAVNLARHLDIDPEKALTSANYKFERRFREMEATVTGKGRAIRDCSLEALEQEWQAAKRRVG